MSQDESEQDGAVFGIYLHLIHVSLMFNVSKEHFTLTLEMYPILRACAQTID